MREAIRLTHAAGEAEMKGELEKSTEMMRRAMKLLGQISIQ